MPEHTNDFDSMVSALTALNNELLKIENLEETAYNEARNVKVYLDQCTLSRVEVVDYLKQASIDLITARQRNTNE